MTIQKWSTLTSCKMTHLLSIKLHNKGSEICQAILYTSKGTPVPRFLNPAGVLGDSFRSLGHRVLGQLPGKNQAHRGLYVTAAHRSSATEFCQLGRFRCKSFKYVNDKRVDYSHGAGRNCQFGMDLLHDPEDENFERFFSFLTSRLLLSS